MADVYEVPTCRLWTAVSVHEFSVLCGTMVITHRDLLLRAGTWSHGLRRVFCGGATVMLFVYLKSGRGCKDFGNEVGFVGLALECHLGL